MHSNYAAPVEDEERTEQSANSRLYTSPKGRKGSAPVYVAINAHGDRLCPDLLERKRGVLESHLSVGRGDGHGTANECQLSPLAQAAVPALYIICGDSG